MSSSLPIQPLLGLICIYLAVNNLPFILDYITVIFKPRGVFMLFSWLCVWFAAVWAALIYQYYADMVDTVNSTIAVWEHFKQKSNI